MIPARQNFQAKTALMRGLAAFILLGLSACIAPDDSGQNTTKSEMALYKNAVPVAYVGETRLYDIDVTRAAVEVGIVRAGESLVPTDPEYDEILDQLIDQRLLLIEAQTEKIQAVPEVKFQLKDARERILSRHLVQKRLNSVVTDEALRKLYDSQSALRQNGREADIRRIRVTTDDEIKTVVQRLSAGEDFAELAKVVSIDAATRESGGSVGFVSRAMLPAAVSAQVFDLGAGEYSKPFKTAEGWEIVQVQGFRLPQQASFEAMRPQLKAFQTYKTVQDMMTDLRAKTEIKRLPPLNSDAKSGENLEEDMPNE